MTKPSFGARVAVLLGLVLMPTTPRVARAGGLLHQKGQLIAVPMQTQAITTAPAQMGFFQPQMSYVQPQMGFFQPQMSYVQPQMSFFQPQMSYVQPQMSYVQPQMSFPQQQPQAAVPNLNISVFESGVQPGPAAGVPTAPSPPTPNVNIQVFEAPSQQGQMGVPSKQAATPQTQAGFATPQPQASFSFQGTPQPQATPTIATSTVSTVPANAIPMQLYLAPRAYRSHHLYEKHHSIYVLRP
jgi:hypothetical protein